MVAAGAIVLQFVPLRLHLPRPRALRESATAVVVLMAVALTTAALKHDYVIWH